MAMMACRVAKKAIYIVSCNTMLLFLPIQSTTVIERILLEFINFNRNGIRLPREAFSISKAKTLKLYAIRTVAKKLNLFIFPVPFVCFCTSFNFRSFQPFIFHLFITSTLKVRKVDIVFLQIKKIKKSNYWAFPYISDIYPE